MYTFSQFFKELSINPNNYTEISCIITKKGEDRKYGTRIYTHTDEEYIDKIFIYEFNYTSPVDNWDDYSIRLIAQDVKLCCTERCKVMWEEIESEKEVGTFNYRQFMSKFLSIEDYPTLHSKAREMFDEVRYYDDEYNGEYKLVEFDFNAAEMMIKGVNDEDDELPF